MVRPATLAQALEAKADRPDLLPVAGGTDVMVGVNFGRLRPPGLLDLRLLPGLTEWSVEPDRTDTAGTTSGTTGGTGTTGTNTGTTGGTGTTGTTGTNTGTTGGTGTGTGTGSTVRIGAGVPYARIIDEIGDLAPGLAMAARTVGSPQIRNAGTVGGNLGTSSPAGDAHPSLLASRAIVEVASVRGTRTLPVTEFYTGVKRNALAPDELVTAVMFPARPGPQQFAKIGTRNAMVIAVCSFGLELDVAGARVGAAIGSAAPTPRVAADAEDYLSGELARGFWDSRDPLPGPLTCRFGELVAAAASPVDDVRGTASYRRHALSVLAARTLRWAWAEYQGESRARDQARPDDLERGTA